MAIINPVCLIPFGAALTNTQVTGLSVQYMSDNSVIQTLGQSGVDDGFGGIYVFSGACTTPADGFNVLATPTTGRWVNCTPWQTGSAGGGGVENVNGTGRLLLATGSLTSMDWGNRQLKTPAGAVALAYGANVSVPITVYVKNVPVLTAGTPADIATINLPAGVTRWAIVVANSDTYENAWVGSPIVTESGGPFTNAVIQIRTGTDGAGTLLADAGGNWGANGPVFSMVNEQIAVRTEQTIYLRQTADSANAGTASFYLTIYPLP